VVAVVTSSTARSLREMNLPSRRATWRL